MAQTPNEAYSELYTHMQDLAGQQSRFATYLTEQTKLAQDERAAQLDAYTRSSRKPKAGDIVAGVFGGAGAGGAIGSAFGPIGTAIGAGAGAIAGGIAGSQTKLNGVAGPALNGIAGAVGTSQNSMPTQPQQQPVYQPGASLNNTVPQESQLPPEVMTGPRQPEDQEEYLRQLLQLNDSTGYKFSKSNKVY